MIQVAYDQNGYSYDINSGYLVDIGYDEFGQAVDAESGEEIQIVRIDPGNSSSGGNPIYTDITNASKDVLIAIFGNANQIPPSNRLPVGQLPPGSPVLTTPRSMIGVGAGVNASSSGIGGNLNISTNTLILIAGGFLLFMLGGKRGKG